MTDTPGTATPPPVSEKYLTFFPQEVGPLDYGTTILNSWWAKHPEKGLVVYREHAPQCNKNRSIAERIIGIYPWAILEYVPVAYVRLRDD